MKGVGVGIECALRRARTRAGRLIATVAAIAIGVAGLMLVAVAGTVAGDRALQRGIAEVSAADRAFTVAMSPDLSPTVADISELNDKIDRRLQQRGFGPTIRTVEYRALAAGDGRSVRFAGVDDVRQVTRLIDGAWPTQCTAQRCEVIALVPASADPQRVAPFSADSQLGLTIVGTAVATSDLLLNGQLRPLDDELIVLADGVADASGLPDYALFRRTYGWQAPVVADRLRSVDVAPLLASVRAISSDPSLSGLVVSGPEDDLTSITTRTRISGNRLAVPIGAVPVLFFGVAVLAGLAGRADHRRTASLLRRRGASGPVIFVFRALEALLPVIGGVVVGALVAVLVGGWLGDRAGLGGRSILDRSIDGSVLTAVVAVGAGVWLLMFAVLTIGEPKQAPRGRRVLASDVAGLSALVVLGVLIGRGSVSTGALNQKVDPVLVAVPVLAAIALAAVVIRLVPLTLRIASSTSPRRWPLTKLTLAEATAQPLRSVATAALIAVTVMFAFLTFGYASTLRLGSRDQAAFAVPYDFRVQLGSSLVRPQALMTPNQWAELAPGTTTTDVLRRGVAVRRSATALQTAELLGLDPDTLRHLHGWRSSFGADPTVLAKLIDEPPSGTFGSPIPADAASLEFDGTGFGGLHIAAVIARVDGTWHELTLDDEFEGGARSSLTPGDAGGELVGFRIAQPPEDTARIEHHIGEGNTSLSALPIDVVVQHVQTTASDGRVTAIALNADRLRAPQATVEAQPDSALRVSGSILGASILVTPPGPGQDKPLNAVVDPATASAAVDGIVLLETSSGTLRVRPSAVVSRFPGLGSRFVIVDIDAAQPAMDLLQPGAGTSNEMWLAADTADHERSLATRLGETGFESVDVDRRVARQTALATDPLAVVTLLILMASAVVALVLGACAVMFGAAADVSDDRPLLRVLALERVQGRRLVAMVAGKSFAAVLIAIPLGVISGRWLLQIATRLVAVSATSIQPSPPLRLAVPWAVVLLLSIALACVLGFGAVIGAIRARRVPDEDLLRGTS